MKRVDWILIFILILNLGLAVWATTTLFSDGAECLADPLMYGVTHTGGEQGLLCTCTARAYRDSEQLIISPDGKRLISNRIDQQPYLNASDLNISFAV